MKEIAICAFLLAKRLALGGAKQAGPRKAQPPGPSRQNIHGSSPARRASSAIAIGKLRRIIRRECGKDCPPSRHRRARRVGHPDEKQVPPLRLKSSVGMTI